MTDEHDTAPLPEPIAEPAAAPLVAPAAVPVVSPAPASPAPASSGRRRTLGIVAEVAGIAGIVVCIALAVAVLMGRSWATDTVTNLETGINAKVAQAVPLLDKASSTVSEVSGRVGAVADAATALADQANASPDLLGGLKGTVGNVYDRYQELYKTYSEFHDTATTVLGQVQMLDRLIPGIDIPQAPIDALAKLDAGVQELNTKIQGLANAIPGDGPINAVATAVAGKATEVKGKLDALTGLVDEARSKLAELNDKLASTADTIRSAITIGSIGLVLVLAYIALLNWVLFVTGRRMRREAATA